MNKIERMIEELCPEGVEWRSLWEVTTWDKKFNSVEKEKQKKVKKYPYLLAKNLFELQRDNGDVFLLSTGKQTGWTTEELAGENLCEGEIVTIPGGGNVIDGMKYYKGKFVTADNRIITSSDTNILLNKFLFYWMQSKIEIIDSFYRGAGIKHPNMKNILDMLLPLPPLAIQREIVGILDKFDALEVQLEAQLEAEKTAREKQYAYYRDKLLTFESGVEWRKLGECFNNYNGMTGVSLKWKDTGNCQFIDYMNVYKNIKIDVKSTPYATVKKLNQKIVKQGDILLTTASEVPDECAIAAVVENAIEDNIFLDDHLFGLHLSDDYYNKVNTTFIVYYMHTEKFRADVRKKVKGVTRFFVSANDVCNIQIPLPPLAEQERIVAILDKFDTLTRDMTRGLPAEIEMRKKQYAYYRDKLLTFKQKSPET